jgi:hypothetical protein
MVVTSLTHRLTGPFKASDRLGPSAGPITDHDHDQPEWLTEFTLNFIGKVCQGGCIMSSSQPGPQPAASLVAWPPGSRGSRLPAGRRRRGKVRRRRPQGAGPLP